jgi:heme exporter protein A
MSNYLLKIENVSRSFGRRLIFKDVDYVFNSNGIYGVSGSNGSGKSTLVKIIAGVLSPSSGKIIHSAGGLNISSEKLYNHIGLVSPYLILYDEFSAEENLKHIAQIRGIEYPAQKVNKLLERLFLLERKDDLVRGYSSGMKQRLKFIFALMHSPELIILDEPTSNLDNAGKKTVYEIITEESKAGIVIIASNEENDLALCKEIINLEQFKNKNA